MQQIHRTTRAALTATTAMVTLAALAGCGSTSTRDAGPVGSSSTGIDTAVTSHPTKVLVVMEENHSYTQMKSGMPYLFGLSRKYGYATHWTALRHPSLPNYLAIVGGSNFGITDDRSPAAHAAEVGSAKSVFDQAIAAGKSAATYAETIPHNCHPYDYPASAPSYAVRHNPWTYFRSGASQCAVHDHNTAGFTTAAQRNALPNVGFLIPNLCHDAHDCSLSTADAFLKSNLAPVLASSDFTSGRLVVVVTADEDDKHSNNNVLTSVLTPRLSGKVVSTALTHYSLTRYIAQVLGVAPLLNGATAPDMRAAFGL